MIYKFIGSGLIITAAIILYFMSQNETSISGIFSPACVQLTPSEQLVKLIDQDLKKLRKSNLMPQHWSNLSSANIQINSTLAQALLGGASIPISVTKNGEYTAEVVLLDLPDEKNPGIIAQISIFEKKSKNKIFEIGRTYSISELNKKASPRQ